MVAIRCRSPRRGYETCSSASAPLPDYAFGPGLLVAARYGLADRLELGLRATPFSGLLDVRLGLIDTTWFAVSSGASVGIGTLDKGVALLELPLKVDLGRAADWGLTLSARYLTGYEVGDDRLLQGLALDVAVNVPVGRWALRPFFGLAQARAKGRRSGSMVTGGLGFVLP